MDNRNPRVRLDLALPPEAMNYADQIRDTLLPLFQYAIVINEGQDNEERGYIDIELCGHGVGEECTKIARWEVGRGRVV